MGQKQIIEVVDDLTGCIIDDFVTVQWSIAGELFEFDTSPDSAAAFMEMLAQYRAASRRISQTPNKQPQREVSASVTTEVTAVRRWAQSRGYVIGQRGRIPTLIADQYRQAMQSEAKSAGPAIPTLSARRDAQHDRASAQG